MRQKSVLQKWDFSSEKTNHRPRIYPHIMHSPFQKIRKARPKALQPRLTNGPARYFAATASISTSAPIGRAATS